MSEVLLAACGVTRSFGPTWALRGADVAVDRHEIVAVMGPSGSGKSTLLHCLAGILIPDAGEVVFDGVRVDQLDERARTERRRRRFGFVFQFGQLVPELSAVENVSLPLLLEGRPRRESLAESAGWLELLGIGDLGARRSGELSGGEAQPVALARALALASDPRAPRSHRPAPATGWRSSAGAPSPSPLCRPRCRCSTASPLRNPCASSDRRARDAASRDRRCHRPGVGSARGRDLESSASTMSGEMLAAGPSPH
jgi:ABC-type ATPase involved in cell division